MVNWKRWAPVVIALCISLGLTAAFATGMLFGDGGPGDPVEVDQNESRVPAPIPSTTSAGEAPAEVTGFASFAEVSDEAEFDYNSNFRGRGLISQSGVYAVDYNNDGYEDLLATGGDKPTLFQNTGGSFERARIFDRPDTRAAHFFDYDNDGWQDLVLAEYGGTIVFYENTDGSFTQTDVGLDRNVKSPTAIASADFTSNGCLDLFIGQNGLWQTGHPLPPEELYSTIDNDPSFRPTTRPGGKNLLFYGDCQQFEDATGQSNIRGKNWTLVASAADFTGDGNVDIHAANDYSADFLYVNNGNGTFQRHDLGHNTDRNAMASVAKDMNGDFRLDLFVTNVYTTENTENTARPGGKIYGILEGNNYLQNTNKTGENRFEDVADRHGLRAGGWGWAAAVDDFTNDGHLDIIHATSGDIQFAPYDRFRTPQVWRGTPDTWERVDERDLGLKEHQARGLARLDYDNDGTLDFALSTTSASNQGGGGSTPFALYENQLDSAESLQLFVRNSGGVTRNAVVLVETDQRTVHRTVNGRTGFLSQNSRLVHVGTASETVQNVRVLWPDGTESTYDTVEAGNRYVLSPDGAEPVE